MSDAAYSSDEFYSSGEEMGPLLNFKMKKEEKPDLNEKSNLVSKISGSVQEKQRHPNDITDIVGKSGKWQIKILILTIFATIPTAWNHLGMTFLAFPVDHWCARPINISLEMWLTEYLPNDTLKGNMHHSQCEMYAINHTTYAPIKSKIIACSSYEYDSTFNSIINKWNLVCENDWMISTSQTIYMIGFLFAVLISGQLADIYGRHPTIMINIVILIIAGFATAFATTFTMFAIGRFFVAVGQGGAGLVVYILLIETIGSEYRVLYMFLHSIGWHTGYLSLPLIAWLLPNWFNIQICITAPTILFLSFFWVLPESPRWLLASGNVSKAVPILEDAAKMNGKDVKDMESQAKLLSDLTCKGAETSKATIFDLLRTPNLRMKTLCLYFIWATIAFVYYGLSLNTNELQGNDYVNFFLSGFMEIPATIFCMVTLNRFGRKKPFFLSLLISGIACFACIFIPDKVPGVKTALAMTGKLFNSASFSIVYIFSAEIFPTVARNVGVGSSSTVARIGSAIAPFMKDLGHVTNQSVPLVIFGVLSIMSALISLKMPETNNQPIPESIDQAEEFGKKSNSLNIGGVRTASQSP